MRAARPDAVDNEKSNRNGGKKRSATTKPNQYIVVQNMFNSRWKFFRNPFMVSNEKETAQDAKSRNAKERSGQWQIFKFRVNDLPYSFSILYKIRD